MIMIELVSAKIGFQLLFYIYDMVLSMSRVDVKNVLHISLTGSLFWEPSLVHNAKLPVDLPPVSYAHSPSFGGFKSCQIQGFQ